MITITTQIVKELRDRTGVGIMDCKKALEQANGDIEKAIDILKKKGQKISLSRADKNADEGSVFTSVSPKEDKGVILVLACETDFVALTPDFQNLGKTLANFALENDIKDTIQLAASSIHGNPVADIITELTAKVGEKIEIKSYGVLAASKVIAYNHTGNKLGVLLALDGPKDIGNIGLDIAMQIAAMNPLAVSLDHIDKQIVEKEYTIAKEKAQKQAAGKPEDVVDKIAKGMVSKVLEQNALLSQTFIKDPSVTVHKYITSYLPSISVKDFIRLSLK